MSRITNTDGRIFSNRLFLFFTGKCFFFADFCLIGRRRSVLGLVLVDVYFLGRDRHAVPVVEDFEAFAASVRAG